MKVEQERMGEGNVAQNNKPTVLKRTGKKYLRRKVP